ncbi:MAG TPA: hypothetical protein VG916_15445, partial [Gemmatimonadaceae bacterium]|nr:hypothetical protein [Gemmatimonadaceae bacterium]
MALAALALGLVFVAGSAGRSGSRSGYPLPRVGTAKLDSQIGEVVKAQRTSGTAAAVATADANSLDVTGTKVKVVVEAADGDAGAAATAVAASGGTVTGQAGDLLDALVPTSGLASLAARPSVDHVRPPMVPVADTVSEAVAQSGAGA